jgi:hypothetical protein
MENDMNAINKIKNLKPDTLISTPVGAPQGMGGSW